MTRDEIIDSLWETSNHGTRREDIEAAFQAGMEYLRKRVLQVARYNPRVESCDCCGDRIEFYTEPDGEYIAGWELEKLLREVMREEVETDDENRA